MNNPKKPGVGAEHSYGAWHLISQQKVTSHPVEIKLKTKDGGPTGNIFFYILN